MAWQEAKIVRNRLRLAQRGEISQQLKEIEVKGSLSGYLNTFLSCCYSATIFLFRQFKGSDRVFSRDSCLTDAYPVLRHVTRALALNMYHKYLIDGVKHVTKKQI